MEKAVFMHAGQPGGHLKDYVPEWGYIYLISFSVNFLPSSFIREYTSYKL